MLRSTFSGQKYSNAQCLSISVRFLQKLLVLLSSCTHDSSNPQGYLSVLLKLDNLGYVLEFSGSLRVGQ